MPINKFFTLNSYINQLPLPKSGFIRLFRGQTQKYEKLLPSSLRPGASRIHERLWMVYAHAIATDLARAPSPTKGSRLLTSFSIG
jgi:hypothetical protein